MKHPLTSKERRGIVAVAAAALLCISSGFILRNCTSVRMGIHSSNTYSHQTPDSTAVENPDSLRNAKKNRGSKSTKSVNKESKRSRKIKPVKSYPTRDPLSQPCD